MYVYMRVCVCAIAVNNLDSYLQKTESFARKDSPAVAFPGPISPMILGGTVMTGRCKALEKPWIFAPKCQKDWSMACTKLSAAWPAPVGRTGKA